MLQVTCESRRACTREQPQLACSTLPCETLQGEAVVKVYGHMSGVAKLASKVCSPGTPLKFDETTQLLASLAKQVRRCGLLPVLLLPHLLQEQVQAGGGSARTRCPAACSCCPLQPLLPASAFACCDAA